MLGFNYVSLDRLQRTDHVDLRGTARQDRVDEKRDRKGSEHAEGDGQRGDICREIDIITYRFRNQSHEKESARNTEKSAGCGQDDRLSAQEFPDARKRIA